MSQTTRRPLTRSPASLVLAREGVFLRDVAQGLGVTKQAVSRILRGVVRPKPEFFIVVRALAGAAAANEIRTLLLPAGAVEVKRLMTPDQVTELLAGRIVP